MRGQRVILYIEERSSSPSEASEDRLNDEDRSLETAISAVHERMLIRQEWWDDPKLTTKSWLATGRLPLYLPRKGHSYEEIGEALVRWYYEMAEGLNSPSRPRLEDVGIWVGAARTVLIDADGQAWDLCDNRLFVWPKRLYLDILSGDALQRGYPLPLDWLNVAFDLTVVQGDSPVRKLYNALGESLPLEPHPWNTGLVGNLANGEWSRDDDRLLLAYATGESILMGTGVWSALRLRVGQETDSISSSAITRATRMTDIIALCAHDLLEDANSGQSMYGCRSCGGVFPLERRQHKDRLCDSCRSNNRRRNARTYSATYRSRTLADSLYALPLSNRLSGRDS